ncbi:hypothetical protein SXCC_02645 [Gluconacetobacter sp. SXCC-1]|nr:hypothetical protein SXCC_02645 [Gluconacetobacter sp. SXCC-1]
MVCAGHFPMPLRAISARYHGAGRGECGFRLRVAIVAAPARYISFGKTILKSESFNFK